MCLTGGRYLTVVQATSQRLKGRWLADQRADDKPAAGGPRRRFLSALDSSSFGGGLLDHPHGVHVSPEFFFGLELLAAGLADERLLVPHED